jgi:nitrate/nitrite transport system ATP-binding protein
VVFQNHSLLPWLTCFENVYLAWSGVRRARKARRKLKARTEAALELVGLATPCTSARTRSPAA